MEIKMGIKTNLSGITFTAGGKATAAAAGLDLVDFVAGIELACTEMSIKMSYLVNDILTPSGTEATNITTINTQITSLS
jgi:hypothetical protein